MTVLFMYPPENVVNEGQLESAWSEYRWHPYPGYQFDAKMNQEKYTKKIIEFVKLYDIELNFHQDAIYSRSATSEFISSIKATPPDTLLVFNFCNAFSDWIIEMSQHLTPLSMIVYHPTGAYHQLPPQGLMSAPNVVYVNSIENWDALENAMVAANARKKMTQSRLLRVTEVSEQTKAIDNNLGITQKYFCQTKINCNFVR